MAALDDLPNEILVQVLRDLRVLDLQTFLVSQTTCRRFRVLVQDLLLLLLTPTPASAPAAPGPTPPPPSRVHPLLVARFGPLFNSAAAFTRDERQAERQASVSAVPSMYLSLQGDYLFPFRRLPCWVRSHRRRATAARPEASWRGLSVTEGGTPITHLDIVKVRPSQVPPPPPGLRFEMNQKYLPNPLRRKKKGLPVPRRHRRGR